MPSNLAIPKFIGTTSLGLLTGISYTLSTLALPSLLTLPSAIQASSTYTSLTKTSTLHIRTLSTLAVLSLGAAYAFSPAPSRHPYLLWTTLLAAIGGSTDLFVSSFPGGSSSKQSSVKGSSESATIEGEVNGEQVERTVRTRQAVEGARAGVLGLAFAMGVVGIWGDGA